MSKKFKHNIIIGLPARNEEAGIFGSLKSISDAVKYAKIEDYQIVVCINGCVDNTASQINKFIKENSEINCSLIQSDLGLVNAQRKIIEFYPARIYIFPDADGKIAKNSIKLLLDELFNNHKLMVVYAKTISLHQPAGGTSLAEKIGLLYDSQKLLTPREYFHGRLFAIRDWYIPLNKKIKKIALANSRNKEMLKYCSDKTLLFTDDVFMSSYIIDRYGLNTIKQVDGAHCYSWPIGSFKDWFNNYRRRNIEMEKMRRWFPQYNYLWPHLNRRTDWGKWFKASWPDKFIWLSYLLMKGIFFCYLRFEFWLLKFNFYQPPTAWKVTASTKKRIRRIIFFDIDNTLITEEIKSLKKVKKEINKFKKLGDVFGINTNRPWPEVAGIYSSLKLNGPAICEGGSYYKLNFKAKERQLPLADGKFKNNIIKFIQQNYNQNNIDLVVSDDKDILNKRKGKIIFITANRRFTTSIYTRNFGHNNNLFINSFYQNLKKNFKELSFNLLPNRGKIIVDNPMVDKFSTTSLILDQYFRGYHAYHISDHENIKKNLSNINFCGIMKSNQQYKKKCSYVATQTGEKGLIQIINNCL